MRKPAMRRGPWLSPTALGALGLLMLLAAAVCAWPPAGAAQSGRRRPAPISPTATPTPDQSDQSEQGESESVPRGEDKKDAGVIVSFVVFQNEDSFYWLNSTMTRDVADAFVQRLGQSSAVSVSPAGRGARKEARDRAKTESETFVVLFQIEEENVMGQGGRAGRPDERSLVIRTYTFAPKTGDLKYQDVIYQRPYQESATIGGVRVPLPTTGRRMERYPSELQLRQAAQDAADRLMMRFSVILPPNR